MDKGFLGRGLKFPVTLNPLTGNFEMSEYEQDIKESIRIILATSKGERLMRPDFGCGIHDYIFEVIDTTTLRLIEYSVREALSNWEPRIEVTNIKASPDIGTSGKLFIDINYQVRATNNQFNMVFPFYLKEG